MYVVALADKEGTAGWLGTCNIVHQNGKAFIVDLGNTDTCRALINYLSQNNLQVAGISISHYHADHMGDGDGEGDGDGLGEGDGLFEGAVVVVLPAPSV